MNISDHKMAPLRMRYSVHLISLQPQPEISWYIRCAELTITVKTNEVGNWTDVGSANCIPVCLIQAQVFSTAVLTRQLW